MQLKNMYSKYQIIKILKNCFRNMNCFSWIELIPVLHARTPEFLKVGEFFSELGHFNKHSPTTQERKTGKKFPVYSPGNSLKFDFK